MKPVDLSTFTWRDAADVALQRTNHLVTLPGIGPPSYRAWRNGVKQLLYVESILRKQSILSAAVEDARREGEAIFSYLGDREIRRAVDIGCGHALIDLFLYTKYRCDIHLVDIETSEAHHHEWQSSGAGYASLTSAKRFLVANGVPAAAVQTTNPTVTTLEDEDCQLILSLLSAGFHYPVADYAVFAYRSLTPGGVFIFDARKGEAQEEALRDFSRIDVLEEKPKHRRLAAIR